MNIDLLDKFSTNLKNTLINAASLASALGSVEVTPMHLLAGIFDQQGAMALEILKKENITRQKLEPYLRKNPMSRSNSIPGLSNKAKEVIEKAAMYSFEAKHNYVGTEHLLKAIIGINDKQINSVLSNEEKINKQIDSIFKNTERFPDITGLFSDEEDLDDEFFEGGGMAPIAGRTIQPPGGRGDPETDIPALSFFCTDLTNPKIQIKIDPVIGREKEIERAIHILSRRNKNNPVLIGEPGVGKTAIVEGLAKRIVEKKVPPALLKKKILRLDLALVVAGTMYRGEFEARFKQIIDELAAHPEIIVFIDEIHTIIGTGGSGQAGTMDAANILKPGLAKGEIRCIGATTNDEYKKHIESDSALERRFQPILTEEPSQEEAIQVLKGLRGNYEKFHQTKIEDSAIEAAVKMSERYIQDKFLPDKAIDLIDEAAAKKKVNMAPDPLTVSLDHLQEKLITIQKQKLQLVRQEKFEEAMKLKKKEAIIKSKIHNLSQSKINSSPELKERINENDIAEIISKITGVPVTELVAQERNKILNLDKALNKEVVGQNEATKSVADFIKRSRAGLTSETRPLGSFIFLGPSGVGKTELAKVLARNLFGDEKALIRIDMSEFGESFNMSKLIGAPAGYVGYKEGNKLTDSVKRKPYSVVLFDEIEKAHPDVFNLLLQILDEGHLTDGSGKKVNFKNTIIIMTSNIGLKNFEESAKIGFIEEDDLGKRKEKEIEEHVLGELKKGFKPEFLNRIDKTIVFKPLNISSLMKIVDLQLGELKDKLKEKNIKMEITADAKKKIAEESFTPDQGARAIARTLQEEVEGPLAEKLISGTIKDGQTVKIGISKENLVIK
ncbi:ATP-dependent Clp protease ATP-binding subunit [Patescibacteria group bacterium]|nr:ATP-dependent Clp protease ATP-binding subunit [Patescibacteria group bacterium]MBU1673004.1 ATP-dependent Clp protease ATP-binding subunit [Patescibacteria group bacterium]MBU1964163.1 ATP-dependent Clp protease ATP-binding subunit [Patescibacteria group bacterium]